MNTTTLQMPASSGSNTSSTADFAYAAARVALALIFIWSGYSKFAHMDGSVGYMKAFGLPFADLLIWPAAFVELVGGLSIAAGFKTRLSALALIVFTVLASVIFHAYWAVAAEQVMNQQIHFFKNVAIIGGLLSLFAQGDGRLSLGRN